MQSKGYEVRHSSTLPSINPKPRLNRKDLEVLPFLRFEFRRGFKKETE
ncbi:MAG: hypothetical protein ACOX7X_02520 [Methanosarcina flavescens]|jgi:hypothetical protein